MPIDYKKYPANWKSEIVPRILKRANNKCEFCGLENRQEIWSIQLYVRSNENGRYSYRSIWFSNEGDAKRIKSIGSNLKKISVVLTIAHMNHDETNMDIEDKDLKALCQYCHLKYDAKEKYRRIVEKSNNKTKGSLHD